MTTFSSLATVGATRGVLDQFGLATKHALGQNFLVSDAIIGKILALAEVGPGDAIVEVGPGIGTLSVALLAAGARVEAIERDADLPSVLAYTTQQWSDSFSCLQADALAVTPDEVPFLPTKLVSNLPYAVAASIVLDYFERWTSIESATVMVQQEVAERMCARPGKKEYGAYTVKLSMYAKPAGQFGVAPGCFFPPPRVNSTVLRLNREQACGKDGVPLQDEEVASVCMMADAAFATRRKTISNSCKTYFSGRGEVTVRGEKVSARRVVEALPEIFGSAGIDSSRRGETLTQQEFILLGRAFLQVCGLLC